MLVSFNRASQAQATLALLTFTLPMVLFSLPGGSLADRLSKRSIIVAMKGLEIVLMGAAMLSLLIDPGNPICGPRSDGCGRSLQPGQVRYPPGTSASRTALLGQRLDLDVDDGGHHRRDRARTGVVVVRRPGPVTGSDMDRRSVPRRIRRRGMGCREGRSILPAQSMARFCPHDGLSKEYHEAAWCGGGNVFARRV